MVHGMDLGAKLIKAVLKGRSDSQLCQVEGRGVRGAGRCRRWWCMLWRRKMAKVLVVGEVAGGCEIKKSKSVEWGGEGKIWSWGEKKGGTCVVGCVAGKTSEDEGQFRPSFSCITGRSQGAGAGRNLPQCLRNRNLRCVWMVLSAN